jgi:hypothetical protein
MDRLSIFLEWRRGQQLAIKRAFQISLRKSTAHLIVFSAPCSREFIKSLDANSFGDILACNIRATTTESVALASFQ